MKVLSDETFDRILAVVEHVEGEMPRRRIAGFEGTRVRASGGLFKVRVEKTAGSPGTSTAAATLRYTVRPWAWTGSGTDTPLGTNVPYGVPRPVGRVKAQTGTTGVGLAFYTLNNELRLYDAGEVPDTMFCSQLQSGSGGGSGDEGSGA